jgi:hypothetical protein
LKLGAGDDEGNGLDQEQGVLEEMLATFIPPKGSPYFTEQQKVGRPKNALAATNLS